MVNKKNKSWTIASVIIIILSLLFSFADFKGKSGTSKSASTSNSQPKKSSSSANKAKRSLSSQILSEFGAKESLRLEQYNKIKVRKDKGMTINQVKKLLGEPSTQSTKGISRVLYWFYKDDQNDTKEIRTIILFKDGRAYSKHISGLEVKRKKKIGLDDYNKVHRNDKYSDVIKQLGIPNGFSESYFTSNELLQGISYTYDLNHNAPEQEKPRIYLDFSDGKLSVKDQEYLK
ncbi:DUF3862 domain-containing protein [Xylocopilactobacillus apicola]|uniref:Lipoprotein SmpA/OmlA domain-containing protein n=1 Tax=Xylocopilactobacillus apicola TaxID=2932184 RepID=A0AAU9CZP2_9LACO|nr:DUF3862 domain-containing protein [Xylocopilactobacillus apicola]BDR59459.1 hypothetical protein XA3_19000 [Xylocopilactobacillus apicola]